MELLAMGRIEIREKPCRKCGHAKVWDVGAGPGVVIPVNPGAEIRFLRPMPVRQAVSTQPGVVPRYLL